MRISDWSSDVCSSDLIDGLLFVAEATADLDRKPGGQFIFGLTEYGDGAGADVGIALFGQGAVQVAKVEQRIEVLDMIVEIIKSENPVQRSRRRRFELNLLRQGLHPVVKRGHGRGSWRENVGTYGSISGVAVSLKKKK